MSDTQPINPIASSPEPISPNPLPPATPSVAQIPAAPITASTPAPASVPDFTQPVAPVAAPASLPTPETISPVVPAATLISPAPIAAPISVAPIETSIPAPIPIPDTTPFTEPVSTQISTPATEITPPVDAGQETSSMSLRALQYSKITPTVAATPIPTPEEAIAELIFEDLRPEPTWRIIAKATGIFAITFIIIFGILEGPAFWSRASYSFDHFGAKSTPTELAYLSKLQDQAVSVTDIKNRPQDYLQPSAQLAGYTLADLSDNQLLIPKLSVNVPIIWESTPDETTMLANLQKGVVHYSFSALPSDGRGKVFISGHSSYLLWDPGSYKTIFANLDRLESGDELALTYQGIVYLYQVTGKQTVKPNDTSVLEPTTEPTLALMTCVPVGTSLNRLIVTSKLLSATSNRPIPLAPQALNAPEAIFHYLPFN